MNQLPSETVECVVAVAFNLRMSKKRKNIKKVKKRRRERREKREKREKRERERRERRTRPTIGASTISDTTLARNLFMVAMN